MVESTERTSTSIESEAALSSGRGEDAAGGRADPTGLPEFTDPRRTGDAGGGSVALSGRDSGSSIGVLSSASDGGSRTSPVVIGSPAAIAPSPASPSLERSVLRQSQRMAIATTTATARTPPSRPARRAPLRIRAGGLLVAVASARANAATL